MGKNKTEELVSSNLPTVNSLLLAKNFTADSTYDLITPFISLLGKRTDVVTFKLYVDNSSKRLACAYLLRNKWVDFIEYEKIIGYDLIAFGDKNESYSLGYMFSFGGGMANTSTTRTIKRLELKITLNDMQNPIYSILLLDNPLGVATTTPLYISVIKFVEEIKSLLDNIIRNNNKKSDIQADLSVNSVEEIKKFKELLDMGIITQEEFDAKKKRLLGL